MTRDELEAELKRILFSIDYSKEDRLKFIFNFVMADRRRICAPMLQWKKEDAGYNDPSDCVTVINETLELAGLSP